MSDGYHFEDCASRKGSETCDCRYKGTEIEKELEEAHRVIDFVAGYWNLRINIADVLDTVKKFRLSHPSSSKNVQELGE